MLAAVSQKLSRVLGARVVASCVCRAGRGRGRGRDRRKWECPAIYATPGSQSEFRAYVTLLGSF